MDAAANNATILAGLRAFNAHQTKNIFVTVTSCFSKRNVFFVQCFRTRAEQNVIAHWHVAYEVHELFSLTKRSHCDVTLDLSVRLNKDKHVEAGGR